MFKKKILLFFLLFTFFSLNKGKSFKLRNLEITPQNILFQTTPIVEEREHEFQIISLNKELELSAINSVTLHKNDQEISCALPTNTSPLENEPLPDCSLVFNEEETELTMKVRIEEMKVYSISKVTYDTDKIIEFQDSKPTFRLKSNIYPTLNEVIILSQEEKSLILDFIFEEKANVKFYIQSQELSCKALETTERCTLPFERQPIQIQDIKMKLHNIYYALNDVKVFTYNKITTSIQQGITINFPRDITTDYTIEGRNGDNAIIFNQQEEEVQPVQPNEQDEKEEQTVITKTFIMNSETPIISGIYDKFILKQEKNEIALFPKELGTLFVNKITTAQIVNEQNKSTLYLLFAQPLIMKPEVKSITIQNNNEPSTNEVEEETSQENRKEISSCSISKTKYSLYCELKKKVNKSQYRLISIETSNSYVINFQSNTDINVYDENDLILTDVNTNFIQVDANLYFNLNKVTTIPPRVKFVNYPFIPQNNDMSNGSENVKLSLDGKKLIMYAEIGLQEGLYQMIYESETEISYKDIFLFYYNELELTTNKITLPTGNSETDTIYIPLVNQININQILSIKYNEEFLTYSLSERNDEIIVNVPKDFSVKIVGNSYQFTITDFNQKEFIFTIEIKDAPIFTFSQTFFVNNDNNEYNVDVTLEKSNGFICELVISNDNYRYIDEQRPIQLTLNEEMMIKYRILNQYEYTIQISKHPSFNELFKPIDECYLQGKEYIIEPTLTEYYALDYPQNDFKIIIDYLIQEKKNKYKGHLTEGNYQIQYYYKNDQKPFYTRNIKVTQPKITEQFAFAFLSENKISFSIENSCNFSNEGFNLRKSTQENPNDNLLATFDSENDKYTVTFTDFTSSIEGIYNLYWYEIPLEQSIMIYNPITLDDIIISFPTELFYGTNIITIKNKDDATIVKNLSQIKNIKIAKNGRFNEQSEEFIYSFENNNLSLENNVIYLSLEIDLKHEYKITDIKLKDETINIEIGNLQAMVLPIYEANSKYVFFNKNPVQFQIKITPPNENSAFQDEIKPVINNKLTDNGKCRKQESSQREGTDNSLLYNCEYLLPSLESQELNIKINENDEKVSDSIELIKYEIKEEDKCLIDSLLENGKIIKVILYTTDELYKVLICNNKYYFGKIDNEKGIIEYDIDVSKYEISIYEIKILINNTPHTLNNEQIVIYENNSIQSITPLILNLNNNPNTINIVLENSIDSLTHITITLYKKDNDDSTIKLTCTSNDGKNLQCTLTLPDDGEIDTVKGDYTKLEYTLNNCIQEFIIDFTIDQFNAIPDELTIDFTQVTVGEGKQYKVTIRQISSSISKITFESVTKEETNELSFCKPSDGPAQPSSNEVNEGRVSGDCSPFSNLPEGNAIEITLPIDDGKERYSLKEIQAGEEPNLSYKKYKNNEFVIRDFSLLTEFFALEDNNQNSEIKIILDFDEKEITQKKQGTIYIKPDEEEPNRLNSCTIFEETKLNCTYTLTPNVNVLTVLSRENDSQEKKIHIFRYTQTKKKIPLAEEEDITITFNNLQNIPGITIYFEDDDDGISLPVSDESNPNSITFSNDKFSEIKEYQIFIGLKDSTHKELLTTINVFETIEVTSISKDQFYKDQNNEQNDEHNIIITFNRNILTDEILEVFFKKTENEGDTELRCSPSTEITMEKNKINCNILIVNGTPQGEYTLIYKQYETEITAKKKIMVNQGKKISSINPSITKTEQIVVFYSDLTFTDNPISCTINIIKAKDNNIIAKNIQGCPINENKLTITSDIIQELDEGEYKIKTSIPENDEFISEDSFLIIENEVQISQTSINLIKGINKKMEIPLTLPILREQIEKIILVKDESISYNVEYDLLGEGEEQTISLSISNIIFDVINQSTKFQIYIKKLDQNTVSPIDITVTIEEKYRIESITNQRIQIGVDDFFEIKYNIPFEDEEKPIAIKLIDEEIEEDAENEEDDRNAIIIDKSNIEINGNTIKCKVRSDLLNHNKIFKIETIFDESYNYYNTNPDDNFFVASFLTPPPEFTFNRLYLTKGNDAQQVRLEIEVTQSENEVRTIKTEENEPNAPSSTGDNKYVFTLSSVKKYSFNYYIRENYNYKFPIHQEIEVTSNAVISISVNGEAPTCLYYKEDLNFNLNKEELITDEYMKRIKIILKKDSSGSFNELKEKDGKYVVDDSSSLIGSTFHLEIIENEDYSQPLFSSETEFTFTNLTYPDKIFKNGPITFTGYSCSLSNLKLKKNNNVIVNIDNIEYDSQREQQLYSFDIENGLITTFGEYTVEYNNCILPNIIMIYNTIQDTKFIINIPPISFDEPMIITITSKNKNDFNLDLIEKIAISQNGNQRELHSPFEVRNNILSFEIRLAPGDTYIIESMSFNYNSNLQTKLFVEEEDNNKIQTNQTNIFKLLDYYYFGFKDDEIELNIEIYTQNPTIDIVKEGEEPIHCFEGSCSITISSSSKYYVKDTTNNFSKEIYVSLIEVDEEYPLCHTVLFNGISTITTGFKLSLTSPVELLYKPILYINDQQIISQVDQYNNNKLHYSFNIQKDSSYIDNINQLSIKYQEDKPIILSKEIEYYSQYIIKEYKGFLREKESNQNFIISFNNDIDDIEISLSSEREVVATANECYMVDKNTFECTIDLSSVNEGKYYLSYTSKCEETIKLNQKITVYNESTLPFIFEKTVYILTPREPSDSSNSSYESVSIEVKTTEVINDLHLYLAHVDVESVTSHDELILNDAKTAYSLTKENPSPGDYSFEYSYMINGNKIPISKKIKLVGTDTKDVIIEPEPSCYYIKEPVSFTVTSVNTNSLPNENIEVSIQRGSNVSITLDKNGNTYTLNNESQIQPGSYPLFIMDNRDINSYIKRLNIVFTDISVSDFYYKNSIIIDAKCVPDSLYIQSLTKSKDKSKLSCNKNTDSTIEPIECSYPSNITSFGNFELYLGDTRIKDKVYISNDLQSSTFEIIKKAKIIKGLNTFTLKSDDFYLQNIVSIVVMKNEEQTLNYLKDPRDEGDMKFNYNEKDNIITFTIDITDLTDSYKIEKIARKSIEGESEETNLPITPGLILTKLEKCKDGQLITSDNLCEYPENVENDSIDKCSDYCQNNGKCELDKNNNPYCKCDSNHFGLQCALTKEKVNDTIDEIIGIIFPNNGNEDDVDEEEKSKQIVENNNFYQAKTISILIIQTPSIVIPKIEKHKTHILQSSKHSISKIIEHSKNNHIKPPRHSFELIHCAILIQINYIRFNKQRLRNLQTSDAIELSELIKASHDLFTQNVHNMNNNNYIKEQDMSGLIIYQGWTNTQNGFNDYSKNCTENGLPIIDLRKCNSISSDYINFQTNLISNTSESSDEEKNISPYFTILNKQGEEDINYSSLQNIKYALNANLPNSTDAKFYYSKGIDIYNPKDPAFQEPCYINEELDYDLTQKYRRKTVYQNTTYSIDGCTYDFIDYSNNKIYFSNCSFTTIPNSYSTIEYPLSNDGIDIDHVDNLPTKCAGDIKNISSNIAFWIYLIIFILLIMFDLVFGIVTKKKLLGDISEKAIENDLHIKNKSFKQVTTSEANLKNETETNKEIAPKEIHLSIESRTFSDIIISNFKSLHPLLSICHASLFSPTIFTSWIFVYNILNLFGFNALYFNETMIEDRITDDYRDNFGYPMKTEFEKIISAIVTSIALNLIVRGITIVTYKQKEDLVSSYKPGNDKVINDFVNSMLIRRIIAGIFMLALNIFFFYYTIVFCGIYVNTQYGWFYSGIWSLFWVWICFAPLYIVIISAVENAGSEICAYYMKRLFIF